MAILLVAFISAVAALLPNSLNSALPASSSALAQSATSGGGDRAVKPTVGGMEFLFDDESVDHKVGIRRVMVRRSNTAASLES